MGRQVRRVPLDFDWPLNKVWKGYIQVVDGRSECSECGGDGYSADARKFSHEWYGSIYEDVSFDPLSTGSIPFSTSHPAIIGRAEHNLGRNADNDLLLALECTRLAGHFNSSWSHHLSQEDVRALVDADRLWEFTRRPRTDEQRTLLEDQKASGGGYWLAEQNGYTPPAAEVNEWSIVAPMGHDSINAWVCIRARCERLGLPYECARCSGTGEIWESEDARQLAEQWTPNDPPEGDGWQLWETVSDGSPISPVKRTPEELATWLAVHDDDSLSYSDWLAFLKSAGGWAPSAIGGLGFGLESGVAAIARLEKQKTMSEE